MKKLNKFMLFFATAVFTFTACEKPIEREPSPAFEGSQAVFFPVSSESEELEPTAAFEHVITIARDTLNDAAFTAKLVVVENPESIFEVPESVSFAAGEKETSFTVKFPKAQVDGTYTLVIEVDESNNNPYLTLKPSYSYTVNIAKWDVITDKKGIIFDGFTNVFYSVGHEGWYVSYARKDNADGSFDIRLLNPYTVLPEYKDGNYDNPIADEFGLFGGYPYNYPEDVDAAGTYNMTIHVAKNGQAAFDPFDLGMIWSYGMFSGMHATSKGYGFFNKEEQSITFPGGTVACAMADYKEGAFYLGEEDLIIYLDAAIYQDIHSKISISGLEDGFNDASIEWLPIAGELSTIESEIAQGLIDVNLENAIDPNPEDKQGEGSDFFNLFRLTNVYSEGNCLAFYWDTIKGKINLPVALQPTGLVFAGKEIFVGPAAEDESFVEDVVLQGAPVKKFHFFLQVQTKDGGNLGVFEEVFFFSTEKIIWGEKAADFVGSYLLTGPSQFEGKDPASMPVQIVESEGDLFLLGISYCSGLSLAFDNENKTLALAPQEQDSIGGTYDITFYTTTLEGDVSVSEPIILSMGFGGIINIDEASLADGFLVRSEVAGGWLDGYYGFKLTPSAAAAPARTPAMRVQNSLCAHKHATSAKYNWTLKGKVQKHNFRFLQ